ncbi:PLP-dependent aminotransferase family protein [Clostridium sp. 001]|uniref:MocR-like pyridoxine biosynthesis transcription factor PdxR n=1 Tax=Clostridium sp. 001 TaxID=1970093 RepID=UPI001C2C5B9F|nr:PLP-dependent aminotransferase family protein [Clostridium sp. 001]QXE21045.1 transcriptional regulator [Clostridium sp. 001]
MRISIDKKSSIPIYVQIKNEIRNIIYSGMLPSNFLLPSERKLAEELNVSRSTVISAYEELKSLGLLESHKGKGTIVANNTKNKQLSIRNHTVPLSWYQFFDSNVSSANNHDIVDIINSVGGEKNISFSAGIADPSLHPLKDIVKLQKDLWENCGNDMLAYISSYGYYPLRESLSRLLKSRNISVSPKEIMILSGSMQGIDFIGRAFLSKGDVVIVEEPTFMSAIELFKLSGAKVIGVPMESDGINLDVLEILLNKYKPKFLYTVPTFQNPTSIVMSLEKRYKLLNLAYKYQLPIIEDDPYSEINYENIYLPSLKSLDTYGYVIYLSTFSKTMFSGMRVGWTAAPVQVIKKFALLKQMTDLHVNTASQYILDKFLREGLYENHIKLICKEYMKKRDLMLSILEKNKSLGISFNLPKGGYYIWCKLPENISQTQLLLKCSKKGVSYAPGNVFYPEGSDGKSYMRLNYTFENAKNISIGLNKLMKSIAELIQNTNSSTVNQDNYFGKPII